VVLGPDGLSRFDDLRRSMATHKAILYAFDLIEHDGEDLRDCPFLDRKAALARLLRDGGFENRFSPLQAAGDVLARWECGARCGRPTRARASGSEMGQIR
jgi:ATP-dependent DNA ligase